MEIKNLPKALLSSQPVISNECSEEKSGEANALAGLAPHADAFCKDLINLPGVIRSILGIDILNLFGICCLLFCIYCEGMYVIT